MGKPELHRIQLLDYIVKELEIIIQGREVDVLCLPKADFVRWTSFLQDCFFQNTQETIISEGDRGVHTKTVGI